MFPLAVSRRAASGHWSLAVCRWFGMFRRPEPRFASLKGVHDTATLVSPQFVRPGIIHNLLHRLNAASRRAQTGASVPKEQGKRKADMKGFLLSFAV